MSASTLDPALEEIKEIWEELLPKRRIKLLRFWRLLIAARGDQEAMRAIWLIEDLDAQITFLEARTQQH